MIDPKSLMLGSIVRDTRTTIPFTTITELRSDGAFVAGEKDEDYVPYKYLEAVVLSEEWFVAGGGVKSVLGYDFDISPNRMTFKVLSVAVNNDSAGKWYVYIREGSATESRNNDDLIQIRTDLRFVSEWQLIYLALTGQPAQFTNPPTI